MSVTFRGTPSLPTARPPHPKQIQRTAHQDPRRLAISLVEAFAAGQYDLLQDPLEEATAAWPRHDADLAKELVLGTVAWKRLYDALARPFLKRPPPSPLSTALGLICHQLFALDRIPHHAALHATLEALRAEGHAHLVGVGNAVGRKLAALRQDERDGAGPLGRLHPDVWPDTPGERHSLPDLLVDDLTPVAPEGDPWPDLVFSQPLCTRTRQGVIAPQDCILRQIGPWTWWHEAADGLTQVAEGRVVVQDAAQGEVVAAIRPRPGELVLDLCAAPGGKALALMDAGCRVIAGDVHRERVLAMAKTPDLAGRCVLQDGRKLALAAGFDVVLVDAPCSNSGVLARRPEARWRYTPVNLASLEKVQRSLLEAAAPLVAEGGRLVYSTCSLSPRENQQIAQALPGWRVLAERLTWPDAWRGGGYVAVLVRI